MTTINLKDFYPWYTHDEYIEVSEEVADELRASRLYEAAYQRRVIRNKAQYSLDCDDGIEYSACLSEPTPQELLERMERFCDLWSEWGDSNSRHLEPKSSALPTGPHPDN